METIKYKFNGQEFELIPTEGGYVNGKKIVGLFSCEEDALSADPDNAAWGIADWSEFSADEQAIATRNSESLSA
jgi:hypothetical protein